MKTASRDEMIAILTEDLAVAWKKVGAAVDRRDMQSVKAHMDTFNYVLSEIEKLTNDPETELS